MAARITGLQQLRAKIRALPPALRADIRRAMETGADEMVAVAKRLAPVDSGALRDSIGWTWGQPPGGSVKLASATQAGETLTVYAGDSEAFYARWVEFGTVTAAAQPYFFPAYRSLRRRIRGRTTRAVSKAVKKVAAGGN